MRPECEHFRCITSLRICQFLILMLVLAIAGCGTTRLLAKSASGYDAIRFNQTFELRDHSINTYTFQVNSVLINDREIEGSQQKVYCGQIPINDQPLQTCVGLEDLNTIVIGPGAWFKEVRRKVPEGALSLIKLQ